MKITLRNINFSQELSRETYAFTAEVWVNGKLLCYASNDGGGGGTIFRPADGRSREEIQAVDLMIQALPPIEFVDDDDKVIPLPQDLELSCFIAVSDYLEDLLEAEQEACQT